MSYSTNTVKPYSISSEPGCSWVFTNGERVAKGIGYHPSLLYRRYGNRDILMIKRIQMLMLSKYYKWTLRKIGAAFDMDASGVLYNIRLGKIDQHILEQIEP